jgi:hypothetical protein
VSVFLPLIPITLVLAVIGGVIAVYLLKAPATADAKAAARLAHGSAAAPESGPVARSLPR